MVNGKYRRKYVCRMAILADTSRQNVICSLPDRVDTVMAIRTISRNIHVIEICGQPTNGGMTIVATVAARNMGRMFSDCGHTVMA